MNGADVTGGIEVIEIAPQRPRRRPLRWIAALLGVVLVVIGLALLIPLLVVLTLVAVLVIPSGDFGSLDGGPVLPLVLTTAGGIAFWMAGTKLIRGKTRTVLFLRKFGFEDAKLFVSHAAGEALGRRWRLVTLDDLSTKPVGTKPGSRWIVRLVSLLAIVLVAYFLYEVFQAMNNPDTSIIDDTIDSAVEDADNPVEGFFNGIGAAIAGALVFAMLTMFIVTLISMFAAVAGAVGIASIMTNRSIRRAERDLWTLARSRGQLIAFLDKVRRTRNKLFAPRIAVVRVIDDLWKDAVSGLADIADAVIIDISDPSMALLWELQMLNRRPDIELIVIGAADRVVALKQSGGHDADDRAVLEILGRRQVLTYRHDRKAFSRQLHNMLEVGQQSPHQPATGL